MKRTSSYYERRAAEILQTICYATLATVDSAGNPWNSPVSAVHDADFCVYWFSDKESQHSRNVRANGKVFIVIYDSTWPEGTGGQGVFIKANAHEVKDAEEIRRIRRMKKGDKSDDPQAFLGSAVRRVYKAVPARMWMNEVQTENDRFIRDYRVELVLSKVRA